MKWTVILTLLVTISTGANRIQAQDIPKNKKRIVVVLKPQYQLSQKPYGNKTGHLSLDNFFSAEGVLKIEHDRFDDHPTFVSNRLYKLYFEKNKNLDPIVTQLRRNGMVEIAEMDSIPTGVGTLLSQPDEQQFSSQWNLSSSYLHLPEAWDIQRGNDTVIIAIFDTGIDTTHPDLKDNLWRNPQEQWNGVDDDGNNLPDDIFGWNFPQNNGNVLHQPGYTPPYHSHGTKMAGTIGAVTDNSIGIAGIAGGWHPSPGIKIMAIKMFLDNGVWGVAYGDLPSMVDYALSKGAKIFNFSWGTLSYTDNPLVKLAVDRVWQNGGVVVAAYGTLNVVNGQYVGIETEFYPGAYSNAIGVSGILQNSYLRGSEADYGQWVDLVAPVQGVLTTYYDTSIFDSQGGLSDYIRVTQPGEEVVNKRGEHLQMGYIEVVEVSIPSGGSPDVEDPWKRLSRQAPIAATVPLRDRQCRHRHRSVGIDRLQSARPAVVGSGSASTARGVGCLRFGFVLAG